MDPYIVKGIRSREILDSRGNPTVETDVLTEGGFGRASVPSGASTGKHEAVELRDGGKRFHGKGVINACTNVVKVIAPEVVGMDSRSQREIDSRMIALDGTENKSRLGANAILSVSLAVARAAASTSGVPLYRYLNPKSVVLPVPMMNIINGGKHAGNELAVQEFMVVPVGAGSFRDAVRICSEVYASLKKILRESYGPSAVNVGDEGGFAPPISRSEEALGAIISAVRSSGYDESTVMLAIDSAASNFFKDGIYEIDGRQLDREGMIDYYSALLDSYPIISLEDPLEEEDYEGFAELTRRLGRRVQVVGDDIFVTNIKRFSRGVSIGAANSILLKVNQIGTLSEAIEVADFAAKNGYSVVVSHRSGETEDNYIADITVALGTGQIKTGAPARGERTSKYNQLMRIEEEIGAEAVYPGISAFKR
ncbi:MAG: phosphopyruvate hydratase [Candidatus Methanosuratincola petrocarbonis]|nr:phosphopyruvate hydratase [Candidatus Methanosuratincola sp.]